MAALTRSKSVYSTQLSGDETMKDCVKIDVQFNSDNTNKTSRCQ